MVVSGVMIRIPFIFVGAVVPALLLMRYFYIRDLNPEPRGTLVATFVLGVLTVIPLIPLSLSLRWLTQYIASPLLLASYAAFLCAAIPEELLKFVVIERYCTRQKAFDEPMDGIVYGATASLGFAALENIMYVWSGGWYVAVLRAFTAVPAHACFGAIMGYHVGRARLGLAPPSSRWKGLFLAVLLHGLYDLPLFLMRSVLFTGWCAEGPFRGPLVVAGGHAACLAVLLFALRRVQRTVPELHPPQVREAAGLE